jgi:hypothetical protein
LAIALCHLVRRALCGPDAGCRVPIPGAPFDEAIEWVKRCPNPHDEECEIEIRQVFEAEDFGPEFTPELREQEERLRAQVAAKR